MNENRPCWRGCGSRNEYSVRSGRLVTGLAVARFLIDRPSVRSYLAPHPMPAVLCRLVPVAVGADGLQVAYVIGAALGLGHDVVNVVAGLEDAIAGATTMEEVRAIIADRYRSMDVSAMTDMLARAAFSARLAGVGDDDLGGA